MRKKLLSMLALLFIAASMSATDIYVKYLTGKTITLDVDLENTTILTVKGMVYDKEGVPVAQQTLIGKGKILEDSKKLSDYGITEGSTLSIIVKVTANEGTTGEYWATCYNSKTSFTAGYNTTVFQAALSGDQLTLTEVPNREIPAGKAVILKSSTATINLTPATTTQTLDGNQLQGTTAEMTGAAGNIYVLNKGTNGVGFYKLRASGTIGANKAYLQTTSGAREFFLFDEATGIEMPTAEDVNADAVFYDLQGRRVQNPTKGLYIVNGKKVFINK